MALIIQKYGGSSLATPEKIKFVAEKIVKEKRKGNDVVVVVQDTTEDIQSPILILGYLGFLFIL